MSVSNRVYNLLRSLVDDQVESVDKWLNEGKTAIDEQLNSWENRFDEKQKKRPNSDSNKWAGDNNKDRNASKKSIYPEQLVDDLKIFGLTPPSNLTDVKKARNREIKRYHPDKFSAQKEKLETAKEILQIYNEVYDRLEKYYSARKNQGGNQP